MSEPVCGWKQRAAQRRHLENTLYSAYSKAPTLLGRGGQGEDCLHRPGVFLTGIRYKQAKANTHLTSFQRVIQSVKEIQQGKGV